MQAAPTRPAPASFIKRAADVASFYGFQPAAQLARVAREHQGGGERIRMHNFTTVATVCSVCAVAKGEPALAWWITPSPAHVPAHAFTNNEIETRDIGEFGLHIGGVPQSVGEIVLLKTVAAVMAEWGAPLRAVRLNTLGDRDSKLRYARELNYYFRKHQTELCDACRGAIANDPTAPFSCTQEACRALAAGAPRAMNFLSEKSRAHFREVLEHIEGLNLPYELDDLLVADERESQLLFALDFESPDATVVGAMGGRFDDHIRKLSNRKEASGLSASILFRKKGLAPGSFSLAPSTRQPRVFFVQLGLRAKMAGLSVIDELRHAQVPVMQSFDAAKLGPQMAAARAAGVSHLIIMGQREALDGTVIVRAIDNSAQEVVALAQLPRFLKTLR
jgi:histidyl-tRNA synthetase